MTSSNLEYFEQSDVWDQAYRDAPAERERIKEAVDAIPKDAHSILDAGCGSGAFLNALLESDMKRFYRVAGGDISGEALKAVKAEKHQCSITNMPFEDREFDIVTCLEVLEHIDAVEFHTALSEIERVARKYILITVPNKEELLQNLIICPKCSCCFSPWYHVRSFDESDLSRLFTAFRLESCRRIGPVVVVARYHPIIRAIHLLWTRPALPANSICPQCRYQNKHPVGIDRESAQKRQQSFIVKCAMRTKRLLGRRREKRKWLLALYSRKN